METRMIPNGLAIKQVFSRQQTWQIRRQAIEPHCLFALVFRDLNYTTVEVEVSTIDQVIESQTIDFVDFMKMDAKGHELFALRGARQSLASRKIGALSFEFGCGNINSRTFFRDFWELLTGAGFSIWRIAPSGKDVPVRDYYEDAEYFRGATNYVAELKPTA